MNKKSIYKSDKFKSYKKIFEPDERINFWTNSNEMKLKSFHDSIRKIKLNKKVPAEIIIQFETAKNVLLYSFYAYRMSTVAKLYSYSVFELSLTRKLEKDYAKSELKNIKGLKSKLNFAIEKKLLSHNDFFLYRSNKIKRSKEVKDKVLEAFSKNRNKLSHEPESLDIIWEVPKDLKIICNLINKTWKC